MRQFREKIVRKGMWPRLLLGLWFVQVFTVAREIVLSDQETDSGNENYKGDIIYLQILGTNGFYAPLDLYPGDLNRRSAWPDGMGKLTKIGMLQQFQLGKALRKRYTDFITSNPKEVEVFSSCEDRSIQSTLCLLASLYAPSREWRFAPHFRWQPVPVTWTDEKSDKYVGFNAFCPKMIQEYGKIINSEPAKAFVKKDEFFYSYWRNETGLEMENWNNVVGLYDTLYRENAVGLEVPRWAKMYWSEMQRITNDAYRWNYNSRLSQKAKVGALIDLMVDRMRVKTLEDDPNPQTKVNVYMTHDWNFAAFLSTMFRYNGIRPPPASTITLELHRFFDTYTLRMLFFNSSAPELEGVHDRPIPLLLRGCSEFCPLAYVTNYFKDFVTKDWNSLCGMKPKPKEEKKDESGIPFSLSQP